MILRQVLHDDLGCASYLIGDEAAGVAAVVDPRLDVDVYLELADYLGLRIEHVFETHNHADHVSGHGRLAAATGATIHIHRAARASYPHEPFEDSARWRLGALAIRALHTPGHRPEHTAFLLARGEEEPFAILSGDSLLVDEVARPDLAIERTEGARQIYRSLHERLLSVGDEVELWPGHIGGSLCAGPGLDLRSSSTIGLERRHNPLLGIDGEDAFVERSLASLGPPPPNAAAIVAANTAPFDAAAFAASAPPALAPFAVDALREEGAQLVDVRSVQKFASGHAPDAVSLPCDRPGFGTRLVELAGAGRQIVFLADDEERARAAAALGAAVGVDRVAGVLVGGYGSWRGAGLPTVSLEQVPVDELDALRESVPDLQIVDARDPDEWAELHIPGSLNLTWQQLDRFPEELDPALPIAMVCRSGQRAAIAASRLAGLGARRVIHVRDGGVPAWAERGAR